MAAIRIARAATKRDAIVKLDGCYHGHADSFLIRGGSGLQTFGIPDSAGVPATIAAQTRLASFNDLGSVEAAFAREPDAIAAVILEPVIGNLGVIPPTPESVCGDWSVASFAASKALFPPSPETIGAPVAPTAEPTPLIASIEP